MSGGVSTRARISLFLQNASCPFYIFNNWVSKAELTYQEAHCKDQFYSGTYLQDKMGLGRRKIFGVIFDCRRLLNQSLIPVPSFWCYWPPRPYRFSGVWARSAEPGVNQQPPVLCIKCQPSLCMRSSPHTQHTHRFPLMIDFPRLLSKVLWAHLDWLLSACHQLHFSLQCNEHPVVQVF